MLAVVGELGSDNMSHIFRGLGLTHTHDRERKFNILYNIRSDLDLNLQNGSVNELVFCQIGIFHVVHIGWDGFFKLC